MYMYSQLLYTNQMTTLNLLKPLLKKGVVKVDYYQSTDQHVVYCVPFQHGFVFHHTYPTYIVLTQWLPDQEPNTLPSFATSYIGMY